jgi:hypothetical protein
MLTKFAAALVATSLIASSAFAAQSWGNSGSMPAAQTSQTENPSKPAPRHKAVKLAKHRSTHVHKQRERQGPRQEPGGAPRWRRQNGEALLKSKIRLPAIRNEHPVAVRTEARIVRTGLRLAGGPTRLARKPDFSRPAAHNNEKRGIREAGATPASSNF